MAKPIPVWSGVVDATGKLHLDARGLFAAYVSRFKNQPVQLVLKKLARPKTHSQMGYLWGVLYPIIADELGYCDYEIDALHDACMRQLRGLKPDPNPLKLRESLREHDHAYTSDYISDLRHWAVSEYGIVTPDAGKVEPRKAAA